MTTTQYKGFCITSHADQAIYTIEGYHRVYKSVLAAKFAITKQMKIPQWVIL